MLTYFLVLLGRLKSENVLLVFILKSYKNLGLMLAGLERMSALHLWGKTSSYVYVSDWGNNYLSII